MLKNLSTNVGDEGLIPGTGRSPGGGNGNPLKYSCHGQRTLVGYSPWGYRVGHSLVTEHACRGHVTVTQFCLSSENAATNSTEK